MDWDLYVYLPNGVSTLMINRKPGLAIHVSQGSVQRLTEPPETQEDAQRNMPLTQPRRKEVGFGFCRVAHGISLRLWKT